MPNPRSLAISSRSPLDGCLILTSYSLVFPRGLSRVRGLPFPWFSFGDATRSATGSRARRAA